MPCTPPPGGVDEEQRKTPSIGVLYGFGRSVKQNCSEMRVADVATLLAEAMEATTPTPS